MADIPRIRRTGWLGSGAARAAGVALLTAAAVAGTSLSPAAGAVSRPAHSAAAMPGGLQGVWCISASDCMAVGDHFSEAHGIGGALIERWNGSTWTVVPSPSPIHFPHSGAELDGVTCVSATDCLAVGWHLFSHMDGRDLPFSVRWNGSKWSQVNASPNPQNGSLLAGMACPAAGECWAVGLNTPSTQTATLTERWNGTKWAVVTTPSSADGQLAAASCSSGTACLAVGNDDSGFALGQEWNGSKWLAEQPARPGGVTGSAFEAVSCPGTACVAVGNDVTAGTVVSLAEGWSGTKWTVEPTPNPSGAWFTFLPGVACTSGSNCWAVGEWGSPAGPRTLIEHWNGTAWSITA